MMMSKLSDGSRIIGMRPYLGNVDIAHAINEAPTINRDTVEVLNQNTQAFALHGRKHGPNIYSFSPLTELSPGLIPSSAYITQALDGWGKAELSEKSLKLLVGHCKSLEDEDSVTN
jgi:hypothetical protein